MKLLHKVSVFTILFSATVLIDQHSKKWAIENLKEAPRQIYADGLFHLLYAENRGAWGSMGSDWPELLRQIFLLYMPLGVLLFLFVYIFVRPLNAWYFTAFSFILGGGVANLIDRVRFNYVVDFMWMGFPQLGTNIFNFADVFIMIGMGIYLLGSFREWREQQKIKAAT